MSQTDGLPPLDPVQRDLAARYFPLAMAQASGFIRRSPWLREEFESAAGLGCVDAARGYDPIKGLFLDYARRRVLGRLARVVRQTRTRHEAIPLDHARPVGEIADHRVPSPVAAVESRDWIAAVLNPARPRERAILIRTVLDGQTQSDAAREMGISKQTASREWRLGRDRIAHAWRETP